ncbi:NB-ARC domain-containing protein, partial [Nocardia tengchongensis]|uniref:NB-ARC domain-containing protein n=1 Tax=Nocardia tengchongensis TaxID=2055889 RepID=UPI00367A36A7
MTNVLSGVSAEHITIYQGGPVAASDRDTDRLRFRRIAGTPFIGDVPYVPGRYVARTKLVDAIRESVFACATVGLFGMGGAGKTTLAAAIARDPDTQEAFADGIIWVKATRDATPVRLQELLAEKLNGKTVSFTTVDQGRDRLAELLGGSAVLLVVDDVWDIDALQALDVVGSRSTLLFTTRNRAIVRAHDAREHEVDELSLDDALNLLSHWTDTDFDQLPPVADALCLKVGNLALGVALVGGMIKARRGPHRWSEVLGLLEQADVEAIADEYRPDGYQHNSVLASITLSVNDLSPMDRERYRELAVFAGRGGVPPEAVRALWTSAGYTPQAVVQLLPRFVDRCLVQQDNHGWYTLHDLEFDVVAHQLAASPGGVAAAHGRLLDGYRRRVPHTVTPGGDQDDGPRWETAPDDGYLLQNLAYHLVHATRDDELCDLLTRFAWMERKLTIGGIGALLADYSYQRPRPALLEPVHGALQLSAHVLADEPGMLAGQLAGRLLRRPEPPIIALLSGACPSGGDSWLCPRTPGSLTEPGGPLERVLQGHTERVTAVAISHDGRYIASGSNDKSVRVWETATGRPARTIDDHVGEVSAVALTADGDRIISGSFDGSVRVWNRASGRLERTLPVNSGPIYTVAVTADSQHIVVGGSDSKVGVWRLADARLVCVLPGHSKHVNAVAVSADCRYVVSGGHDRAVRVWALADGTLEHTLCGHQRDIEAVAISADGRYVVSGSTDQSVRVWDLTVEPSERLLGRHNRSVRAVAVTADGSHIVSAGDDKIVRVWNSSGGPVEYELLGHTRSIYGVAISPDGRLIVSGGQDNTVRVWNPADTEARPARDKARPITAVIVLDDGRRVLYGSDDRTVGLWSPTDGTIEQPLQGPVGAVEAMAVTPDHRRLVTVGYEQPVSVWDLSSGKLLQALPEMGAVYA